MASIVDYARSILQEQPSYEQKAEQPARSASAYPQARSEAGELPFSGGVRGSGSVFPAQAEGSDQEVALEGLPTRVKIPATGEYVTAGPDPRVRQVARQYMQEAGLPYNPPAKYARVDPARSQRIADAYEQMPHDPEHPLAQAAYQQMAKEVMDQYAAAKRAGFKAEFWDPETEEDPYAASPRLAIEDIRKNHHMYVFPTFSGYGQAEITEEDLRQNPLLADSGERWNGKPVTINDIFRAIHDYYGHAKEGVGFRADGEENAWRAHASMFSPLARLAMTAETRGQNSWVNYGPKGEDNRTASGADTVFADQKIGVVPLWVLHEGAEDFMDPQEIEHLKGLYERHGKAEGGEVESGAFSPVPGLEAYHEDPAFQEWFGNSVTHREGVPVTYYTGTSKDVDFNKFKVGRHGAWFTADPAEASQYAKQNDSMGYKRDGWNMVETNTASRVIPAHLKIENPYTGPLPEWAFADNYKKAQSDWFDLLRSKGHDGWIPEQFGGQLAVVLKEPHQIKSVNNRTWDPKNPRMDKAQGGEVEDDTLTAYHASPRQLDEFKPSTFRGSTFFSATPKGALSGASAGMNEMIMETATEGYKGPMHLHEVAIDPSVIRGLHYTPKEKDWFHSLPKRVVGDDDLEGAMRAKPNPYIAWDDVYEPNKIREGLYEYVRREAPPSLTYEQARKTGRNVYGQQHSHYAPDGDEKAAAQNVLKSGMKGYLVHDEGGLSIAMADPSHAKIKRVGRFAQGGEVEDDGIAAYHGSPHDYPAERLIRSPEGQEQYIVGQPGALPEVPQGATVMQDFPLGRMRMDKIGTGEGAQAYGHGLYTAEVEETAKDYRDRLKGGPGGANAFNVAREHYNYEKYVPITAIDAVSSKLGYGEDEIKKAFLRHAAALRRSEWDNERDMASVVDAMAQDSELHKKLNALSGRMYEVRINAHPDHLLDWDKPLSEQSEHVRNSLTALARDDDNLMSRFMDVHNRNAKADELYATLTEHFVRNKQYENMLNGMGRRDATPSLKYGQQLASEALHNAGIKGIRYLDAGSRGATYGTRNYVVFDDKLVNVKRKYADGGVVKESSDGKEAREDRTARGNAAGRPGRSASVNMPKSDPVVERALMIVSRKA